MTEAMLISAKPAGVPYLVAAWMPRPGATASCVQSTAEGSVDLISCGTTRIARPASPSSTPTPSRVVPEGHVGEIWISSPSVSPGYFRRPDATAETFGFTLDGDDRSYMRSGDLGAMVDGELFVTGRLKEVIILRGRNIYPQDIEAATAALSTGPRDRRGIRTRGAVRPRRASSWSTTRPRPGPDVEATDELLARVGREIVQRFSLPSVAIGLVPLGSIPRTPTGKVRRKPARALLESGRLPLLDSARVRRT